MLLQLKCTFSGSGGVLHPEGGFSIRGVLYPRAVLHPRGFSILGGGFSILGGSPSRGVLHRGGSPSRGVLHLGGFSIRGVSIQGGFSIPGGFSIWGVSIWGVVHLGGSPSGGSVHPGGVLHPGGVHQGGCPSGGLSIWGVSIWGVLHPGVSIQWVSIRGGVPCDISHHAFDVTCLLPPHQLRHINSAPAYILLPGHVTCKACWDTHSPSPVDRHTPVKT